MVSDYVSFLFKDKEFVRIAVLSGPNLTGEIEKQLPAATVIASQHKETAVLFQSILTNDSFRVYTSLDVVGVSSGIPNKPLATYDFPLPGPPAIKIAFKIPLS